MILTTKTNIETILMKSTNKKIFIDTNILIDLLSKREPFYKETAELFTLAEQNNIQLSISSLSIANTHYILTKQIGSIKAKTVLRKIRILVSILSLDDKIVELALNDEKFNDFEDCLQYYTAIKNKQNIIITRNLKDFSQSSIPVLTASQFLETLK